MFGNKRRHIEVSLITFILYLLCRVTASVALVNQCSGDWEVFGTCISMQNGITYQTTNDEFCYSTDSSYGLLGVVITQLQGDTSVIILTSALASTDPTYSSGFQVRAAIIEDIDAYSDEDLVTSYPEDSVLLTGNNYVARISPAVPAGQYLAFRYESVAPMQQVVDEFFDYKLLI